MLRGDTDRILSGCQIKRQYSLKLALSLDSATFAWGVDYAIAMPQLLQSVSECCRPCPSPLVENIPGPQGGDGAAGSNGTDGVNAYTTVSAPFAMPPELGDVTIEVADSTWTAIGQPVFLGDPAAAAKGTFIVIGKPDATHLTLHNPSVAASGIYPDNSAPGTAFPAATAVSPAGFQGATGAAGAGSAPTDATYITQTPNATLSNEQALSGLTTGFMFNTTATGVVSIVPRGTADANVAPVNDAAGLTNGQSIFATASGIESKTPAAARTALGLGSMALQDSNAVNITGGTITGVTVPAPAGVPKDWLVFQNQQLTTVSGGGITQGSWAIVPLNTEVVDTGGNGSIAANVVTLAAGTYRVRWGVPCFACNAFQTRLWNVTTAAILAYGETTVASSTDTSMSESVGTCRITVTGGTQIRLEAQCGLTNLTNGFGKPNSFGGTEVYATIELEKEVA